MITFVAARANRSCFDRLLAVRGRLGVAVRVLTYEAAFRRESVPSGTVVFTDFDLLHGFEIDAAGAMAQAVAQSPAGGRVLNHPARVLQRYALLAALHCEGLSPVTARRLEDGGVPDAYPVFLRTEAGCAGPETDLIADIGAYRAALAALAQRGLGPAGRIAVRFVAERDRDGYFRKYGAFVVGDRIIPQHILRSPHWNVKSRFSETDPAFIAEEERYVAENPHADDLLRIARIAGVEYGRIDYGLVDGRIVVFEINTNPTYPRFAGGAPAREARRKVILERFAEALARVDTGGAQGGTLSFARPETGNRGFIRRDPWYLHPLHTLSRGRAWAGLLRRATGAAAPKPKAFQIELGGQKDQQNDCT